MELKLLLAVATACAHVAARSHHENEWQLVNWDAAHWGSPEELGAAAAATLVVGPTIIANGGSVTLSVTNPAPSAQDWVAGYAPLPLPLNASVPVKFANM